MNARGPPGSERGGPEGAKGIGDEDQYENRLCRDYNLLGTGPDAFGVP